MALSCIVGAILLLLYEQVTVTRLAGLVVATAAIPLLVAGTFRRNARGRFRVTVVLRDLHIRLDRSCYIS